MASDGGMGSTSADRFRLGRQIMVWGLQAWLFGGWLGDLGIFLMLAMPDVDRLMDGCGYVLVVAYHSVATCRGWELS